MLSRSLLLLATVSVSAAAHGDTRTDLDRGEVLVHVNKVGGYDEVVLRAVLNAPPARVWRLVSNCGNFARTMPRIKASREISRRRDGNGVEHVVCRTTVDMPFPYSDPTSVTEAIHTVKNDRWSRRWWLLRGDYKENKGSWVLTPFKRDPQRTFLTYRVIGVPKAWVPDWIRRSAQKRTLPRMIQRFRELLRK